MGEGRAVHRCHNNRPDRGDVDRSGGDVHFLKRARLQTPGRSPSMRG
jgi:hypothetical protein